MHSTKLVYAENLGADFLNFVSSIKALDVLSYRKTIFGCIYLYIFQSVTSVDDLRSSEAFLLNEHDLAPTGNLGLRAWLGLDLLD